MFDGALVVAEETVDQGADDAGQGDGDGDAAAVLDRGEVFIENLQQVLELVLPDDAEDGRAVGLVEAEVVHNGFLGRAAGLDREVEVGFRRLDEVGVEPDLGRIDDGNEQLQFFGSDVLDISGWTGRHGLLEIDDLFVIGRQDLAHRGLAVGLALHH